MTPGGSTSEGGRTDTGLTPGSLDAIRERDAASIVIPLVLAECRHDSVMTWGDHEGHRMWSCSDCSRRMYPACLVCVNVGHRNEVHPAAVGPLRDALAEALGPAFLDAPEPDTWEDIYPFIAVTNVFTGRVADAILSDPAFRAALTEAVAEAIAMHPLDGCEWAVKYRADARAIVDRMLEVTT